MIYVYIYAIPYLPELTIDMSTLYRYIYHWAMNLDVYLRVSAPWISHKRRTFSTGRSSGAAAEDAKNGGAAMSTVSRFYGEKLRAAKSAETRPGKLTYIAIENGHL